MMTPFCSAADLASFPGESNELISLTLDLSADGNIQLGANTVTCKDWTYVVY